MPLDPIAAADLLAAEVAGCAQPPPGGWPSGAPARDFSRSPVAARVGRLAASQGLQLYHYEHRAHLPLPLDHVPDDAPDLADPPAWQGGVLPERKYQSFRHDQAIGSFHPGMRAKWSAHELCHALVGFAWRPDASPLFLATASRLAETLPVALWYFFDEAHLRRCPLHLESGPLFRVHCTDCEAVASARVDEVHAAAFLEDGRLFLERELRAVARTRRLGQPVPHVHGSLDLCSDGLAYAASHGPRLRSPTFARFAERLLVPGGGVVDGLDALIERMIAVLDSLVSSAPLPALAPSPEHGRVRWIAQDLGWRLLQIADETEGEALGFLHDLTDEFAQVVALSTRADLPSGQVALRAAEHFAAVAQGYADLFDDWVVPEPDQVFALGYATPGLPGGSSLASLAEGVQGALPLTSALLGERLPAAIAAFAPTDEPVRAPIATRFATWLLPRHRGPLGDLARFEAAVAVSPMPSMADRALGPPTDGRWRLAGGVAILQAGVDLLGLAASADFGDLVLDPDPDPDRGLIDVDGAPVPDSPSAVAVSRAPNGEVQVHDLALDVARALLTLGDGGPLALPDDTVAALWERGLIRAAKWQVEPA